MRILLIEDDQRLSSVVKKGLEENGFAVDISNDGEDGQYMAESETYDVIVLDIMLPKLNGVEVCRNLRNEGNVIPILMLTAKSNLEEKVIGLDSGADDYMVKPFDFAELLSRIRALIRRSKGRAGPVLQVQDLTLDSAKHAVKRGAWKISLTPKEFSILEYLMHHAGEVVSRTMIVEHAWDYNFDGMSNIVDVFMATLRKKIDNGNKDKLLHTVHGVGYKISEK